MGLENLDTIFAFSIVMLLLSLVITMMVQAIVAILGLRGKNLLWGITHILERSETLKGHAKVIAEKVLSHSAIKSPAGGRATAIGSDELTIILRELATDSNSTLSDDVKKAIKTHIDSVVPAQTQAYTKKIINEVKALFPNETDKIDEVLTTVQDKTSQLGSELNQWFDTIMNRATDRFVMNTRIWAIVFASVLSLGLQLDSLDLLKKLSTNPELRAKLVQSADATLLRAQNELLSKSVAVEAIEAIQADIPDLKGKSVPAQLQTRAQGVAWIKTTISTDNNAAIKASEKYQKKFDELTRTRLTTLGAKIQELHTDLESSRLGIFPTSLEEYKQRWRNIAKHSLGILISILLLSLGAPFWFNALRTIATLRPMLAGTTDPSKGDQHKT